MKHLIKYNYVIYHKKCPDGFTGFFLLHQSHLIHMNAKIMPDVPSAKFPPNDIYGNVIIVDVAYKFEVLEQIIKRSKSVLFIDHHVTIRDDTIKLEKLYKEKFKTTNCTCCTDRFISLHLFTAEIYHIKERTN
jgi:hypothetical protein